MHIKAKVQTRHCGHINIFVLFVDESEVHHRLATSELVFAAITPDTLADLQSKANTSETAKRVWNGWQD